MAVRPRFRRFPLERFRNLPAGSSEVCVGRIPGSSTIDLIVCHETCGLGRRVFLDFRSDPSGLENGFGGLEKKAFGYLQNSHALLKTPLARLEKMNPQAAELYARRGIDLGREPLRVAVCAQHHNGGIAVDRNWQTCVRGLYAAGEAAGTFGARRPGGSALNSSQVGSMRAAQHIACATEPDAGSMDGFAELARAEAAALLRNLKGVLDRPGKGPGTLALRARTQEKMSLCAVQIRDVGKMKGLESELRGILRYFYRDAFVTGPREIPALLKSRDLFETQLAVLSAMRLSAETVGSRGSALVLQKGGKPAGGGLPGFRFKPESPLPQNMAVTTGRGKGLSPALKRSGTFPTRTAGLKMCEKSTAGGRSGSPGRRILCYDEAGEIVPGAFPEDAKAFERIGGERAMNAIFMAEGAGPASPAAYDRQTRQALESELDFLEPIGSPADLEARREDLRKVEVIFSSWGMFRLSEEQIRAYLPRLRAVFYAAGSVQGFAAPFLRRGVRIFSAYAANAVPVAEYAAAQIVLACKGFFQSAALYRRKGWEAARRYAETMPGNYGGTVGILGAGTIGKLVIGELKRRGKKVLVFDPFLPDEAARDLCVEKCGLERLFAESPVISNHLANKEQTRGILGYRLFSAMLPNATFLNTGRGAQVVEADLARALREEPARTAVLDVTDPEPAAPGSPFFSLPNAFLTPHIAGSMGGEIARMGRYMYEEYRAFANGGQVRYEVTEIMLKTMA